MPAFSVRWFLIMVLGLSLPGWAMAQPDRYELGQRLRAFEQAWDLHKNHQARKASVEPLLQATTSFFSFRLGEAGRQLDRARFALQELDPVTPEQRWAESLAAHVAPRLQDSRVKELLVNLRPLYLEKPIPQHTRVRLSLVAEGKEVLAVQDREVAELPAAMTLPLHRLRPGDHVLGVEVFVQERRLASWWHTVSFADHLTERLQQLEKSLAALAAGPLTTDQATGKELLGLLKKLSEKQMLETNYPAARLLEEAETLLRALGKNEKYYGPARSGQHWLRLVGARGQAMVRVQVPPQKDQRQDMPLVLALHGAGGSENMFFDGYGDGLIAKLCAQRGWLLAAPRGGLLPLGNDLGLIIDALAELYPVERRRVFVVGHSMGAGQALQAAGRMPERLAGVAALGGGNRLKISDKMKDLPFFVGVGDRDFALNGARQLRDSLKQGGATRVDFREYQDIEHLVIVQHALPEVFAFFDGVVKK